MDKVIFYGLIKHVHIIVKSYRNINIIMNQYYEQNSIDCLSFFIIDKIKLIFSKLIFLLFISTFLGLLCSLLFLCL